MSEGPVQKRIRIQPNSGKFEADEYQKLIAPITCPIMPCIASKLLPGRTPQPGWCFDALGGLREHSGCSIDEQKRLILFWDVWMHDRATTIPLHICEQTLNVTPTDSQGLLAFSSETFKTFKGFFGLGGCLWGCHVHECITASLPSFEIGWQVHEVVLSFEAFAVQTIHDLCPCAILRQIVKHQRGTSAHWP